MKKTDMKMTDTITYADALLSQLDILNAVCIEDLKDLGSIKEMTETAYNTAEELYDCISDLHLELMKEETEWANQQ